MSEYHKINTIYKRGTASPKKTLIEGDWSAPEFECLANAEARRTGARSSAMAKTQLGRVRRFDSCRGS